MAYDRDFQNAVSGLSSPIYQSFQSDWVDYVIRTIAVALVSLFIAVVGILGVGVQHDVVAQGMLNASDATFPVSNGVAFTESVAPLVTGGATPYGFSVDTGVTKGALTFNPATGVFTYTAGIGQTGQDNFEYLVVDANGREVIRTITFNIAEPLVAADATYTVTNGVAFEGSVAPLVIGGVSPYEFAIETGVNKGSLPFDPVTGEFTYTASIGYFGQDSFVYRVADADGREDTGTITFNLADPLEAADATYSVTPGVAFPGLLFPLISGGEAPNVVSIDSSVSKGVLDFAPDTGSFTYTATIGQFGQDSFVYRAVDSYGREDTGTITFILPNGPPVAADGSFSVVYEGVLNESMAPLASGGEIPYLFTSDQGAKGSVSLNQNTGAFTYTAGPGQTGTDQFEWMLTDSNGREDTGIVTIVIGAPPIYVESVDVSVVAGESVDVDITLLISGGTAPFEPFVATDGSKGSTTVSGLIFTYSADAAERGADVVEFKVPDSGDPIQTGSAQINITILAPELAAADSSGSVDAGQAIDVDLAPLISGGTGPFTFTIEQSPVSGSADIIGSTLTYTSDIAGSGDQTVVYRVTDVSDPIQSTTATVTISVIPSIPALTASDLNITLAPGESINGVLTGAASGGIPPYAFGLGSQGSQGTAIIEADGTFSYTANATAVGTDQFTYTLIDSEPAPTGAAETTGTVFVTFSAQATEPAASPVPGTIEPTLEPTSVSSNPPPAAPVTALPSTGVGNAAGNQMLVFLIGLGIALVMLSTGIWRRQVANRN